jgi:multisubunit Na+/H+ antiporter MnhE subunit
MLSGVLLLALVWVALSRRFDPETLGLGLVGALLALRVQRALVPAHGRPILHILRHPGRVLLFLLTLAQRFVLSTLFTTRLILFGREEGRLIALPIRIENPFGQFLLLNSITLTPSTISLLVEGDLLYIHWLQQRDGNADPKEIKESLERRIEAIFPGGDHADR